MRLFKPRSWIKETHGYEVRVTWFYPNRPEPVEPYELLVQGWDSLSPEDRTYAVGHVDELLTESEAESLRDVVWRAYRCEVDVEEEELPLSSDRSSPLGALPRDKTVLWYPLRDEEAPDPDRPVAGLPIFGWCDLRHAERVTGWTGQELECSISYGLPGWRQMTRYRTCSDEVIDQIRALLEEADAATERGLDVEDCGPEDSAYDDPAG